MTLPHQTSMLADAHFTEWETEEQQVKRVCLDLSSRIEPQVASLCCTPTDIR